MLHVHIGTGSLGLGFVAYLTQKAGLRVILSNRLGSDSDEKNYALRDNRAFNVHLVGNTTRTEHVPIDKFIDPNSEELIQIVAVESVLLLTTAVKEGLPKCIPVIARLISGRMSTRTSAPLFVMACENRFDSHWLAEQVKDNLKNSGSTDELHKQIRFLPCVVDRICSGSTYDPVTREVLVYAEPYARWIIERTEGSEPLEQSLSRLVEDGTVTFVPDLRPYQLRKLWLVNGPHLLAAILAKAAREPRLNVFLGINRNKAIFERAQEELTAAFRAVSDSFTLQELVDFNARISERFREFPDTSERIMSRFRKTSLEAFIKDLDKKVGEPVRVLGSDSTPFITRVVFEWLRMVSENDYIAE